ncbi:MAG: hypothetical protein O3B31_09605 [Chloroflexi bacterium]|nr:hypothetical protein [Chloroflexota bacterium]MDA1003583.1 hypothetical protein [Chloroflexota bacterium]
MASDLAHALAVRGRAWQWPSGDFTVMPTGEIGRVERDIAHTLFEIAYDRANHAYLDKSLTRLRFIAFALVEGEPAGFALNDRLFVELPYVGRQWLYLGGLCCIDPRFRRRGLFGYLERLAGAAAGDALDEPILAAGRMAHPASYRGALRNPTHVPRVDESPTPLQRAVGLAVAEIYGSRLDPETFATVGDGTPIGYPRMDVEATPEEWRSFAHVNRDRGDALLSLTWSPRAPDGWDAPRKGGSVSAGRPRSRRE